MSDQGLPGQIHPPHSFAFHCLHKWQLLENLFQCMWEKAYYFGGSWTPEFFAERYGGHACILHSCWQPGRGWGSQTLCFQDEQLLQAAGKATQGKGHMLGAEGGHQSWWYFHLHTSLIFDINRSTGLETKLGLRETFCSSHSDLWRHSWSHSSLHMKASRFSIHFLPECNHPPNPGPKSKSGLSCAFTSANLVVDWPYGKSLAPT